MLSYDLYMASDGSTFIDRTERLEIINKDESELSKSTNAQQIRYNNSEFYLRWNLGELLFNRQGVDFEAQLMAEDQRHYLISKVFSGSLP